MAFVKFETIAMLVSFLAISCKSDSQAGLKSLGTVNGKSFFLERNKRMNWTEAWTYCNDSGLALASLETVDELDFLTHAMWKIYPGGFWLDGQAQAISRSAFYNDKGNFIEMNVQHKLDWGLPPRSDYKDYCGDIVKHSGHEGYLFIGGDHCGNTHNGTVCQKLNK